MNAQQANSFNEALRNFKSSLPREKQFTETSYPEQPDLMFMLQERLPDRGENGSRYKNYGGITLQQAEIIASTSQHIEEMQKRIHMLIMEGKDTTKYESKHSITNQSGDLFTLDQVKELVVKALIESEKQRAGTMPETAPVETAERVAEPPAPAKQPVGMQHKKRKSVKEYQTDNAAKLSLATEQAKIMDSQPPILRKRDGHIDGRWMRQHKKRWAEHLATSETAK